MKKLLQIVLQGMVWFSGLVFVPAWIFETIIRFISGRFWEFRLRSASIYFSLLTLIALILLLIGSTPLQIVSVYFLTSLLLIGIASCGALLMGDIGDFAKTLGVVTRRQQVTNLDLEEALGFKGLWIAITSYLYTAIYFGVLNYFFFNIDNSFFKGILPDSPNEEIVFNFIYSSYISMVTLGPTDLKPEHFLMKSIFAVQMTISLFFALFIFSLFVSKINSLRLEN